MFSRVTSAVQRLRSSIKATTARDGPHRAAAASEDDEDDDDDETTVAGHDHDDDDDDDDHEDDEDNAAAEDDNDENASIPSLARYMESRFLEVERSRSSIPDDGIVQRNQMVDSTALFKDPNMTLSPNAYPNRMLVTVEKIHLTSGRPRPLILRVVFRGRRLRLLNPSPATDSLLLLGNIVNFASSSTSSGSPTSPTLPKFTPEVYQADLTFHSIVFDTLKIDVYERGIITTHLGRAYIRLKELSSLTGSVVQVFPLHPRRVLPTDAAAPVFGTITTSFDFSHTADDDASSLHHLRADSICPDDSASVIGDIGDPELASTFGSQIGSTSAGGRDGSSESADDSRLEVAAMAREASAQEFMDCFRSVTSSSDNDDVEAATPEISDVVIHNSPNSNQASRQMPPLPPFSPTMRTTGSHASNAWLPSIFHQLPMTNSTLRSLKELSSIAAAFFNHGWKVSKVEFARALLLVSRWQSTLPSSGVANLPSIAGESPTSAAGSIIVTSPSEIRIATHFAQFAMAAYGSIITNPMWWEASRVYIRDLLRVRDDRRTARDTLGVTRSDMLEWEFGPSEDRFKPRYFVCWDRKTSAVVLCVRGTVNIGDLVIDMCAEYEPYRSGYAHRGILRCARWLHENLLPRLRLHIAQHKARTLYVVGHSLGAAIASIFTMLVRDSEPSSIPCLRIHCFAYACPPCLSADLCDELIDSVDSYINQDDMVPRMSYGSMTDLRDILIRAAELGRATATATMPTMTDPERFEALSAHLRHLQTTNVHPKVYVPGTIHHIRPSADAPSSSAPSSTDSHGGAEVVRPHLVIERTLDRARFGTVVVKIDMLYHHFPNRYETALWEAYDALLARVTV